MVTNRHEKSMKMRAAAAALALCASAALFPLTALASAIIAQPDNTGLVGYWSFDASTINGTVPVVEPNATSTPQ
jgi:hypothetical protein